MGDEEGLYWYGEKELWETEEGCRYREGVWQAEEVEYWVWEEVEEIKIGKERNDVID